VVDEEVAAGDVPAVGFEQETGGAGDLVDVVGVPVVRALPGTRWSCAQVALGMRRSVVTGP
jgi:hypothetical protein